MESVIIRDNVFVDDYVVDILEIVLDGISDLCDGVLVGVFDYQSDRFGVFDFFNEGEFFFVESLFIDEFSLVKDIGGEIFDIVLCDIIIDELQMFYVFVFCLVQSKDVVFCEDIKREWVNIFLVDDDEVFFVISVVNFFF